MLHRKLPILVSLFLVAVIILSACVLPPTKISTPTPSGEKVVPSPTVSPLIDRPIPPEQEPCVPASSDAATWDCSQVGREVIFSGVPENTAVISYHFDEEALLKADVVVGVSGFSRVISVAGDFRFVNQTTNEPVTAFASPVSMVLRLTDQDLGDIKSFEKIYLVQMLPDQNGVWKLLYKIPVSLNDRIITVFLNSWGVDPPTGLGVGN
jgi:hypothetical protein